MLGDGFIATLLSIRLENEGAGAIVIGAAATAYFGGLTLGAIRSPAPVQRVGHISAFAAAVSLLSADTLIYALIPQAGAWIVLRLIDGMCVAMVFVCIESWLNQAADVKTRGSILAAYMVALYSGQAAG